VGGAVRMNAGAHGGEIADCMTTATIFDIRSGRLEERPAAALGLSLWGSAQVAEATRGAVQSIPREQHEAAAALGCGWVGFSVATGYRGGLANIGNALPDHSARQGIRAGRFPREWRNSRDRVLSAPDAPDGSC
jgi:hypothetical protein